MPPQECKVRFCHLPREGRRQYCKLHLEACPRDSSRRRSKRCHYFIEATKEEVKAGKKGHRCKRPAIFPVIHGLCSVHHPDQIRKRFSSLEEVVGDSEDPMKELQALGHAVEKAGPSKKGDLQADLDARFEAAGIKKDDGAKALKKLLEALKTVRTRSGEVVRDKDGEPVQEIDLELLFKVLSEFRAPLGIPEKQVAAAATGGGLNIHVKQMGITVPEKVPIPIDAECVDVED